MKIKDIIIKIRKDNNLTQEELATILNISRSSIALYESGLRIPNIDTLNILSSKFKINIKEFYNKDNINEEIKKSKSFIFSSIMVFLLAFSLEACSVVDINNKYGYNIYNDKLLVQNSVDICIIRVKNFLYTQNQMHRYSIVEISGLLNNCKYLEYKAIMINKLSININVNKYYIVFISNRNHDKPNKQYVDDWHIIIDYNPFIEELKDYDESLEYYEQTGECKVKIDYYLDLINNI